MGKVPERGRPMSVELVPERGRLQHPRNDSERRAGDCQDTGDTGIIKVDGRHGGNALQMCLWTQPLHWDRSRYALKKYANMLMNKCDD